MTTVIGYNAAGTSRSALELGAALARSADSDVVVAVVIPSPWEPGLVSSSPARLDHQYRAHLQGLAEESLATARRDMPTDVPATYVVHGARSVAAGLIEVAEQHEANAIVLGSSREGLLGRISLGTVADRLVHSSPVPIGLAPRGYRAKHDLRIDRVTVAYGGTEGAYGVVIGAAGVAGQWQVPLRLASFVVRSRGTLAVDATDGQAPVTQEWLAAVRGSASQLLEEVATLPEAPAIAESVIGYGESWTDAVEDPGWEPSDILVVGSSDMGPLSRVFLGSAGIRIVRASPVPVVIVPRRVMEDLADPSAN